MCTILLVTVSEVTIIATYTQLCAEVRPLLSTAWFRANGLELPLVVAKLRRGWEQRGVDLRLLYLVLLFQAPRYGLRFEPPLLQLQLPCLRRVWFVDGYGWILNGVCFCQEDL